MDQVNQQDAGEPSAPVVIKAHQPVPEAERIVALDVLRGFALLGIFMVNMQFFALPIMHGTTDPALATALPSEVASWFFVKAFCEYKFISMFSLLFGIGLVVQMTRAEAKGRRFGWYFLRRTLILAGIGLAHALLLWYGDILFIYACLSVPLFFMRHLKPRTLLTIAASLVAVSVVLSTSCMSLQIWSLQFQDQQQAAVVEEADGQGDGVESVNTESDDSGVEGDAVTDDDAIDAGPARGWAAIGASQLNPMLEEWTVGEQLAYQEGPWSDAFAFRSVSFGFAVISGVFTYGWHVMVMFLLGAALMKLRFFDADRRAWHWRCFAWGLAVGIPLELLSAGVWVWSGFDPGWMMLTINALHEAGSYAMCLGYVGGVILLVSSGMARWLLYAIACLGRTALTNYLLQTITATGLMYWWGLGWFDEVSRPQMIGLVLGIYAIQVMVSTLWLRVFRIGPAEWLWRSLTYLKPQPLMRSE